MLTITEALADIKTLGKRIDSKAQFIQTYLVRQEMISDPLAQEGGSVKAIAAAQQSIHDLAERVVVLRAAIHRANAATVIPINGTTRSLADWLVWRRDAVPLLQQSRSRIDQLIQQVRRDAGQKGFKMSQPGQVADRQDVIIHLNEIAFAQEGDMLTDTLGQLDGLLSLKNATTTIDVP